MSNITKGRLIQKEHIVFSQRLAGHLMIQGFVLKRIEKSNKQGNRNIFIFNESEDLLRFIKLYKDQQKAS